MRRISASSSAETLCPESAPSTRPAADPANARSSRLRASRCWDFAQICGQQAQRISIRIDLREPGALQQFEQVLKAHAGPVPVLLEAATAAGIGRLTLNGGRGLRVDAALPGLLRSLPGVSAVSVQLARPWASGN